MTDDYTPTTDAVRQAYAQGYVEQVEYTTVGYSEFDRWLRKVKADAWAECYDLWALGPAGDFPDREENPYL